MKIAEIKRLLSEIAGQKANPDDPDYDDFAPPEVDYSINNPNFIPVLDSLVDDFIQARPNEKRNRALWIHTFCRSNGDPWPEEVVETLMTIVDNEAHRRLPKWFDRKYVNFLKRIEKEHFWYNVYIYVRNEQVKNRSIEKALEDFYFEDKHLSHLGNIELDTFMEYYYKNTKAFKNTK